MESLIAVKTLSALAQPTRLEVFQVLVQNEPDGLPAGELAKFLCVPQNTMSSHLNILSAAELVIGERRGRSIIYRSQMGQLRGLLLFLLKDCCGGNAELCEPLFKDLFDIKVSKGKA